MHRWAATLTLAAVALPVLGQAPGAEVVALAHLKDVRGNVLVSGDTGLASGNEAAVLNKGARVITTANSDVTVAYENGCEVKLKPNQRFEVKDRSCKELVASIESIMVEPAGIVAVNGATGGAVGGLGFSGALPIAVGGLAGLALLQNNRESQAVSPH
jgi:hypothetical protein